MIPAKTLDKPVWRMALHNALSNNSGRIINTSWFLNRAKNKPFLFTDISEILGIAESESSHVKHNQLGNGFYSAKLEVFSALIKLNDGRFCFFEAQKDASRWIDNYSSLIYSKDLRALVRELPTQTTDNLKLHYLI